VHLARMQSVTTLFILAALFGTAPAAGTPQAPEDARHVVLTSVSNRADLVSGGDVLVDITIPAGTSADDAAVTANGRDVTHTFVAVEEGRLLGLIEGLPLGTSTVEAVLPDGRGARLEVTNHPIGGPVFAGPQVQPWVCDTEKAGLGPAGDDQCNAPTKVEHLYMSAITQQFKAYDPASPPADVATTTTDQGRTVPYVIRLETGTLDRGIHQIAVLSDPSADWSPIAPLPTWNGKLLYPFGGGTAPNHHQALPGGVLIDSALSRGFMVATSSLNVHGQNANDTVAAEAVMMLQEHIIETYGPIRYTIGAGCSGGGLQQYMIADTYPGLLDGLIPHCSYPDVWTTAMEVVDCVILNRYFQETSPHLWAVAQQRAFVAGHQEPGSCQAWEALFGPRRDPSDAAGCDLPREQVYDPETNPTGTRCTINDYQVAIWGPRPETEWGSVEQSIGRGFAARPLSNVGIQYGLEAVASGLITVEQFVDLNEKIGGIDIDATPTAERTPATGGSVERAYRTGQIVLGDALNRVPIIDLRGHSNTEIHTDVYSQVVKQRLVNAHGHAENLAVWTGPLPVIGDPEWAFCGEALASGFGGGSELPTAPVPCHENSPLLLMDRWLTAIEADTSSTPREEKVLAHRPDVAVDSCFIAGQQVTDQTTCAAAYPVFQTTRMVAGGPASNDVIDCALSPLDRHAYSVTFTDGQWARMEAAFPDGVCDWSEAGTGYQSPPDTWLSFPGNGVHPVPLGPAPVSLPFGPTSSDHLDGTGAEPVLPATGTTIPIAAAFFTLGVAAALRRPRARRR
jgi:hypothetical protein